MQKWIVLALVALTARVDAKEAVYDTKKKVWLTVSEVAADRPPGSVVVLGEEHFVDGSQKDPVSVRHHENQLHWLQMMNLRAHEQDLEARLGLEFLEYPVQAAVEDFRAGRLSEDEFKEKAGWGGNPFAPYGALIRSTPTRALNIPLAVARQVARGGPDSLSADLKAFLPPLWERGSDAYFARFSDAMGGHVDPAGLERYFWAQCLRDDTMAWQAVQALTPHSFMTIVVGAFHVEFGHGLPARLIRQGATSVHTMLQVYVEDFNDREDFVKPDPEYGDRADYLWVYSLD